MPGLDEFEIIARYFAAREGPDVLLGIGDDAAVIDVREPIVVAVDTLVGGVHFPPELDAHAIGYRALAVNLSDLAAMGSTPRWATLALTLPEAHEDWLKSFAAGFFALAERHAVGLVGGDTTRGPLAVTVQVIGTTTGGRFLSRAGGRAGDDVYVTGTLGDSAAALPLLARRSLPTADEAELMERFRYPTPRVAAGIALAAIATAAIDVSDGLVADLGHVCRQSGCGARIDIESLPLSTALLGVCSAQRAEDFALGGGDDYELCFTARPERAEAVQAALAGSATRATRIGGLVAGSGVACCRAGRPVPVAVRGYTHF
jgi:thiamine-monophosphate kinase